MANQFSTTLRNNRAEQIEATVGPNPKLHLYTGVVPANCAAGAPSGQLCTLVLPADWQSDASNGAMALAGTWSGVATGSGLALSYRIYDNADTNCHIQGVVSGTGGGGDLMFDLPNITIGQTITILSYGITEGNS